MTRPERPAQKARVFLFHCEAYDVAEIRSRVLLAMTALDLRPSGRTLHGVTPRGAARPLVRG